MTEGAEGAIIARDRASVASLAARASLADRIAVDVEANGLFVYRAELCTVQLAWREGDATSVGIVDAIGADLTPLIPLLGASGPVKVLHDLTFDARMLEERGAPLANVRDTSVSARMLDHVATGLASMLASELSITVDKRFQQHDWARRPLLPEHIAYLTSDVLHLLDLDDKLAERVGAAEIEAEVAEECAYKLATASRPPRDTRPTYVRIKGAAALDALGRATLRRLCEAREEAASAANVPPFKIVGSDGLLDLARARPKSSSDLRRIRSANAGRAASLGRAWLAAIAQGAQDGDIPEADRALFERPRVPKAEVAAARARDARISGWRRAEAKRRGVSDQVVLPGHCAHDLAAIFAEMPGNDAGIRDRIAAIEGFGAHRMERYGDALVALGRAIHLGPEEPQASDEASA